MTKGLSFGEATDKELILKDLDKYDLLSKNLEDDLSRVSIHNDVTQ